MGIIETLKDVVSVVQKVDNIDLVKGMMEVQAQAYALLEENHRLRADVTRLAELQATHASMTFRRNSYWAGDEGPFCSRCWDTDRKQVRLHEQEGYKPMCPACNTVAADPDQGPPSIGRALTGDWG